MSMNALPNELLIHILSHLDYWDLKLSVPLISHRFRNIINSPTKTGALDRALFRDKPRLTTTQANENREAEGLDQPVPSWSSYYTLHPILPFIIAELGHPLDKAEIHNRDSTKRSNLSTLSIANENAISPAVRWLTFRSSRSDCGDKEIDVIKEECCSVTVKDVLEAFVMFYEEEYEKDYMKEGFGGIERVEVALDGVVTLYEKQLEKEVVGAPASSTS